MPSPRRGGIQETPFLQNINILSFSNFSTPNRGLGLKSTLKTKTNVLVSTNFLDALLGRASKKHPTTKTCRFYSTQFFGVNLIDSQQETPFLQNINILSFSNFSDALPPSGGGSLLPNNFVFGQHKNI